VVDESAARTPVASGRAGLVAAISLFTALPIPARAHPQVDEQLAARALRWLPVIGVLVGLPASVALAATTARLVDTAGALLGATVAVAVLAVVTRAFHLDGLADTVDGLGGAATKERALAVMRQPDIGAFGVVALVLVLGLKVAGLAAIAVDHPALAAYTLVLSEVTGRSGVVLAAGPGVPSARSEGFGALVAGTASRAARWLAVAFPVALAVLPAAWTFASVLSAWDVVRLVAGVLVGLGVAVVWRRHVVRRIGGVTGDVFGSIVELGSVATVLAVAVWG
jgi:adenosylcobinamide-GDP ribazoletransferase